MTERANTYGEPLADEIVRELRYLRLKQIVGPTGLLPISASTWWQGVKEGRYPQPMKLGPRITVWRRSDIEACIEQLQKRG